MSSVKLVSHSMPLDSEFGENMLEHIAYVARVSNPTNQNNFETSERLVRYLTKHKHWSPLEMVSLTLEINTTRDIARQILRHRSFSFQEFSQRYAEATELGFECKEARLQDTKNRQNSIENDDNQLENEWYNRQMDIADIARSTYEWAILNGIAKEQARAVMPEGITCSRLYMAGTLRSWCHYIQLRSSNGTQKEHMIVARQCADAIESVFPMIREFVSE